MMTMADQDKAALRDANRLTDVETAMMHLQNDYETINSVVLENARRLDILAKAVQQLTDRLSTADEPDSERKAEDEIPPHY
ncbi:MAG: putative coiled-coil protein SlyX [Mariniblastus sp.]|jgi:uncharacterized coiled-coil protein SlyX